MNRSLFIIIGITIIISLIAIWVYIVFGEQSSNTQDQEFADLNFPNNQNTDSSNNRNDTPVVDVTDQDTLNQLTTVATAGFQEVLTSTTSDPLFYYVEAGTGHIFTVNLETGEEERISGTTMPGAKKAIITPSGKYILLESGFGNNRQYDLAQINGDTEQISYQSFEGGITDFTFSVDNNFLYTVNERNTTVGKSYNPETREVTNIFTIPFRETKIDWGKTATDTHFVYPKANPKLEGYLYQITNGKMNRLPIEGYGLTSIGNEEVILYSLQSGEFKTMSYTKSDNEREEYLINLLPEKCAKHNLSINFTCGIASDKDYGGQSPHSWYQGDEVYSDGIWAINNQFGTAKYLADIEERKGRVVDIINPQINSNDSVFYFQNKLDGTVWSLQLNDPSTTANNSNL